MDHETSYLAKLARPALQRVLPRERLFDLLDRLRQKPVIWVTGPPGCGKTTLVADYIEARKIPCLWYQVDEGDNDPASFFYYMGIGAQRASPEIKTPLPLFTSEFVPGISTFTKRFFTELFDRLKDPSILVLDNCQEADTDPQFSEILRHGLSVVPPGVHIFVLSRRPPPPVLARLNANRLLALVDWEALRFTEQETRDLVEAMGYAGLSEETVDAIHRKTEGWIAGLILMLRQAGHAKVSSMSIALSSREQVFDYFASEVLIHANAELQAFLIKTALLPRMTAPMAEALTDRKDAGEMLAELSRNHFFTDRHDSGQTVYQYHGLFRDFLLVRGRGTTAPESLSKMQDQTAAILESEGFFEDAVSLYLGSGNVDQLARLIPSLAPALLAQGRNRTVEQWITKVPVAFFNKSPWLIYWLGAALMPFNPKESRGQFEAALRCFEDKNDVKGILMALSGILVSITYAFDSFLGFDEWIPVVERFRVEHFEKEATPNSSLIVAAMLYALTLRQPAHESFPLWEQWARTLLEQDIGLGPKTQLLIPLILHRSFSGDLTEAAHFIGLFRRLTGDQNVTPLAFISLWDLETFYSWLKTDFDLCRKACSEALDLAETTGIRALSGFIRGQGAAGELSRGDLKRAGSLLMEMESNSPHAGAWEKALLHSLRLWKALIEEDDAGARFHASVALDYSRTSGMPQTIAIGYLGCALSLHRSGKAHESYKYLTEALNDSRQINTYQTEFACLLAKAEFDLDQRDEISIRKSLAEALALGESWSYFNTIFWRPRVMARLCAKALQLGTEEKYVQVLIRRRDLFPDEPPYDMENWPWLVQIQTLGRFQILVDGKPINSGPKTPKRLLSLLKAIIALGGRGSSEAQVTDGLWPDSDGDTAHRSFATTLHRLRKLIGRHDVIDLSEGRLSLNPRYVWVDVWAFENLVDQADPAWRKGQAAEARLNAVRLTEKAIALYGGSFLSGDPEETWNVSPRERLRTKFIRTVKTLCDHWKEIGEITKAIHCYHRCLEADDRVEEFYHGLMVCHQVAGQKAEALAVYERCKKILSKVWGIEPSRELQALKRTILVKSS